MFDVATTFTLADSWVENKAESISAFTVFQHFNSIHSFILPFIRWAARLPGIDDEVLA